MPSSRSRLARFSALAIVTTAPTLMACAQCARWSTTNVAPKVIVGHSVRFDPSGKLLSWSRDRAPYAHVARLAWDFLERVPVQSNGLPTYFTYSRFDPTTYEGVLWPHNPAGLNAMLIDSASTYFAFSGDANVIVIVRRLADHQLSFGTTPPGAEWASVPYASAAAGELEYGGADDDWCDRCGRGDGLGVIEPDKVGELGFGYLKLFEMTAEARYLDAARACAAALAAHVREGDETHSPWPFRVNATSGTIREEYSANVVGAIALFDELARTKLGSDSDVIAHARARSMAWRWLISNPMKTNVWGGYFEDIPIFEHPEENPNQYTPLETAKYLLEHPELDTDWREHVSRILTWVGDTFGGDANHERGVQLGAQVISEQHADMAKMGSHTARYGAIRAMFYAKTGDPADLERAFRSLNWATYTCSENGVVAVGEDKNEGYWFSDGYGDYIRQFMRAMGAVAEWAPPNEDHILATTSVITQASYAPAASHTLLNYATYDPAAVDEIRLRVRPRRIRAGGIELRERHDLDADGWVVAPLRSDGVVVRIRHSAPGVVLTF